MDQEGARRLVDSVRLNKDLINLPMTEHVPTVEPSGRRPLTAAIAARWFLIVLMARPSS